MTSYKQNTTSNRGRAHSVRLNRNVIRDLITQFVESKWFYREQDVDMYIQNRATVDPGLGGWLLMLLLRQRRGMRKRLIAFRPMCWVWCVRHLPMAKSECCFFDWKKLKPSFTTCRRLQNKFHVSDNVMGHYNLGFAPCPRLTYTNIQLDR